MSTPTYQWQPTTRVIAAKAGLGEADVIRFDQNTIGESPAWVAGLLAELDPSINEYPQSDYFQLRSAIAAYRECPLDAVVVGAGADELIAVCASAFLGEGDRAIGADPTYSLYRVATAQQRASYESVPRREDDWSLDVDWLVSRAESAELVWLCVPNNPTGLRDADADLERLLTEVRTPVVIDAAYGEFTGDQWWPWIERFPHLIVLGTFSKAHGLAATRVGYALAGPDLAGRLNQFRPPGSVSTISAALAEHAARNPQLATGTVASIGRRRNQLADELSRLGWKMRPTVTNFVLGVPPSNAQALQETVMWEDGLVMRGYAPDGPLGRYLRVTVRTAAENQRLIEALERRTP